MSTQIQLLKKYGLPIRGMMGQHLLIDPNMQMKIVQALDIKNGDKVLEIGPGLGALTALLLDQGCEVWAIEKDPRFIQVLEGEYGSDFKTRFHLIEADALALDWGRIVRSAKVSEFKIISNLPYYITAPLLLKVCEYRRFFSRGIFTMQKEVGKRLTATPGTKDYGRLTLALRYAADVRYLFDIPPSCFTPKPEVDSAVVELIFHLDSAMPAHIDETFLFQVIQQAFGQRRKTLFKRLMDSSLLNLTKETLETLFQEMGFNRKVRGEDLLLKDYIEMAHRLEPYRQSEKA